MKRVVNINHTKFKKENKIRINALLKKNYYPNWLTNGMFGKFKKGDSCDLREGNKNAIEH